MATKETVPAGVFELTEDHTQALAQSARRGRAAAPPRFVAEVRAAYTSGKTLAVQVVGDADKETAKVRRSLADSARAVSRELGEQVRVRTRTVKDHATLGSFVAFTAEQDAGDAAAE